MPTRLSLLPTFRWLLRTIVATWCCYFTSLCLITLPAYALDPSKHLTQYLHRSWRIQDGSLPAAGNSITQTSDGFLWLGAGSEGMYRFDGVRFVPWPIPIKGKAIKTITNIYGDNSGGLWVLGEREIIHLKGGVVTSHLQLPGLQLFERIREDPDGSLWVVRGQYDVSDKPLCRISGKAVQCFGKADGIPIAPAGSLHADSDGGFWIGGQTTLVHWRNGASKLYPIEGLKNNAGGIGVNCLARGADGAVWVGILKTGPGLGLGRLTDGVFKPFVTPRFDGSKLPVTSMRVDREGSLWVGTTNQGLFRVHGDVVEHYGREDGLSGDYVGGLFEDQDGTLWVTTTNGVDSFRDGPITVFSAVEGLALDAAVGLLATRDGTIWIANAGSLDRIVNGTVTSIRAGQGLPGSQVAYMLEDRAGNLWVGVDDGLYHLKNGQFSRIDPPDKPFGMVLAMIEDKDGNIWAACVGPPRKLLRIRDFRVVEEFSSSQVPPGHYFAPDPKGGIWITTLEGEVILLRNGVIETRFPLNPGGDPYNRQIIVQPDGSVLASSENGLVGWRNGKVQRMTTKNGLRCNTIVSFIEDAQKQWWLNTHCGVMQFPDSELQKWWASSEAIVPNRLYDVSDGARLSGEPSFNSAALSPDGRVWFATGFVVMMLDPSRLAKESQPAVTFIESMTVDRKEFVPTAKVRIPPHPRDLQIDYTSPSFLNPKKVKFRYRLEGYDSDWHDAGTRRQAFYTDLPPGNYSFHVVACNSDGVWNNTPAKLAFSIAPAFYQTTWFRTLSALMLLALLGAAYQLRVHQLHKDVKKLQDVIETIPAMAFTFLPDGSNAFINQRWEEYTGLSAKDTAGSGWTSVVHPEDLHIYEPWRALIAAGMPFEFELRFRSAANADYRWFLARGVPQRDRHGKILRWYGILTDIQDLKRTEEAVRRSEEKLKIEVEERSSLLDLTHDSISVFDLEFIIKYWNEGAEEFYGWPREEAIGRKVDELLRTVYPKPLENIRAELLETDQWEGELKRTKANGSEVVVSSRWSLRRDQQSRPVAILETSNDITERKRREDEIETLNRELATRSADLETSNKDLEAFAASVSHDLRAPLRRVASFTELLHKTAAASLSEKSSQYVTLILEESSRMGNLIDDLLTFSRITRAESHHSMINMDKLVAEAIAEVSRDTDGRKIKWKTQPFAEWRGDRSMLRVALVNLLSNAVKFTRHRPDAEIEIGCAERNEDHVVLFVRDNGAGFDMKYYNKLFGVFQRLHSQEDFEGTGIGLATVQRIVQRHGGRVWAQGKVDDGAIFYFSLSSNKPS